MHLCVISGDYQCGWHRDVGPANRDNTYEKEMEMLGTYRKHMVKWHMALVDDPSLWIVPGSQKRYRTEREHQCMLQDPQGERTSKTRNEFSTQSNTHMTTAQRGQTTMKQKLHDGEFVVILLTDINVERGYLEDSLALGNYDCVYVDGQHSPLSEEKLAAFCAMTEDLDIPAQMRLPHTYHTYLMGRYADFGLSSIMVPEVMEESTVDEAIEYFYFGTRGRRSWGNR